MKKIGWIAALACAASLFAGTAYAAGTMSQTAGENLQYAVADVSTVADSRPSGCTDSRRFDMDHYDENDDTLRTISVSASKSIKVVPDMAQFAFGVTNTDKDATKAQKANTKAVNDVIDTLKKFGVSEKSITTSGYSMYPQYDYSGDTRKLTGYEVRTTLTVNDQTVEDAGTIITKCVEAGINDIDYINFLCTDYDDVYLEALAEATKTAYDKADVIAKASGMRIANVVSVSEGYQDTSASYRSSSAMTANLAEGTADLSVMAGETEITANVTAIYEMK